jgi:hypothetical protein
MRRAAILLGSIALGCTNRVSLPEAPTASAPLRARQQFYRRYRSANTLMLVNGAPVVGGTLVTRYGPFTLADGTTVSDPRDLAAVVGENTPVALAAERSERRRNTADGFYWGGFALVGVGGGLGLAGLLGRASGDFDAGAVLWSGIGTALVGSILLVLGQTHLRSGVIQHREAAFDAYDLTLRRRLALCGEGDTPGGCEPDAPPSSSSTPVTSAPSPWGAPPP